MKDQARRAQTECGRLQRDNDALQRLLREKDLRCEQLEIEAESAESNREVGIGF